MRDMVFRPSFGNKPSVLVGRDDVVSTFRESLDSPVGGRERSLLLLGQRGTGKTVLLLEFAEVASQNGFIATRPIVAAKGMLAKILEQLRKAADEHLKKQGRKMSGGSVGAFGFSAGIQFDKTETETKSFSYQISEICSELTSKRIGTLFIIDEVQSDERELQEFIISYQEMVGMGLDVAVAFAGLPSAVSSTLKNKVLTFLNRSMKIYLQPLRKSEIYSFYRMVFRENCIPITDALCKEASEATDGSPYMMQLIGHHIIKNISEEEEVTKEIIDTAIALSIEDYYNDICETALKDLSERDIEFLIAMSKDDKASTASDMIERLNMSNANYQQYKRRLRDAGVIEQERRGVIVFMLPRMKEYLRRKYAEE